MVDKNKAKHSSFEDISSKVSIVDGLETNFECCKFLIFTFLGGDFFNLGQSVSAFGWSLTRRLGGRSVAPAG